MKAEPQLIPPWRDYCESIFLHSSSMTEREGKKGEGEGVGCNQAEGIVTVAQLSSRIKYYLSCLELSPVIQVLAS